MSKDGWKQVKARELRVGDRVIRNVQPGFEWSPGPYGAFLITEIRISGDEFRFIGKATWSNRGWCGELVEFSYDGDEEVMIG